MKTLLIPLAAAVVLLCCSTSFGWTYVTPFPVTHAPVVHPYWSTGTPYFYRAPTYAYRPIVVTPAPVIYRYPAVVRPNVYVHGRSVRNIVRSAIW